MKYSFSFFLSFLSIGFYLTIYSNLYAQNVQQDKNMLIETISKHFVSPEAASIGKFYEMNVNLSSGIPQIGIPIYNVSVGKINFPIQLDYNSSGIKVDEISSRIGIGWALNAGGRVMKQTNGLDDDLYLDRAQLKKYINNGMTENEKIQFINSISRGTVDGEPDVYIVSAGALNFRFVIDLDGQYLVIPGDKNVRIQRAISGYAWIITDTDGTKYKFNDMESSTSLSTVLFNGPSNDLGENQSNTGWLLKQIEDVLGNKVDFEYLTYSNRFTSITAETRTIPVTLDVNAQESRSVFISNTNVSSSFLNKITFAGGQINFIPDTTPRKDVEGDFRLKEIEILRGQFKKTFRLYHSYMDKDFVGSPHPFNTIYDNFRLRLDSVQEIGQDNALIPPHRFIYEPGNLPFRNSFSQDHWGYYNGRTNTTLVPYQVSGTWMGADRRPDFNFLKRGVLKKIIYPTKGEISFDYEINKYKGNPEEMDRDSVFATLTGNNNTSDYLFNFSKEFVINPSVGEVEFKPTVNTQGFSANCSCFITLGVRNKTTNAYVQIPHQSPQIFKLLPGTYVLEGTIETEFNGVPYVYFSISMTGKFKTLNQGGYVDGPGLRIKKITKNFKDNIEVENFDYRDPVTGLESGQVSTIPEYFHNSLKTIRKVPIETYPGAGYMEIFDYKVYKSESKYPLSSSNGGYVSYKNVNISKGESKQNGETQHLFTNYSDYPDKNSGIGFPSPPLSITDWKRGKPLKIYQNSNTNAIVKSISNKYIIPGPSIKSVKGVKIGSNIAYLSPVDEATLYSSKFIAKYDIYSDVILLERDTTIILPGQSQNNIYSYNSIYQNSEILQNKSDGTNLISKTFYPKDFNGSDPLVAPLLNSHILDIPVERVNILQKGTEQRVISGTTFTYDAGGKGIPIKGSTLNLDIAPLISSFKFSNRAMGTVPPLGSVSNYSADLRYKVDYVVNRLDNYGNVLEITVGSKPSTVYLWGYGGQYPIAKIENATYSEVVSALGNSSATILNGLNSATVSDATINTHMKTLRDSLDHSQVTSYTYKPLIGMTSMTDPRGITEHYEYDGFQRLKEVLDFEKNVLTDYQYHYRP